MGPRLDLASLGIVLPRYLPNCRHREKTINLSLPVVSTSVNKCESAHSPADNDRIIFGYLPLLTARVMVVIQECFFFA